MNPSLPKTLLDPRTYPHSPGEVSSLETHISWLFFAGDRVYKVKKPVKTGFLDFSTLSARKHACLEELRLNRRLAPWMYLGLTEIREEPDGSLRIGGQGPVVEYAVEMRRLPAERMLDRLLDQGDVDNRMMRALAAKLARFHSQSASGPGIDEHGSFAAVRRNCRENFQELEGILAEDSAEEPWLSARMIAFLASWTEAFLKTNRQLFVERVEKGQIREGHGDLHAGNICILDAAAEEIAIYDCLEFSAALRCGDRAGDLAFLLMDLDLHCFRGFAAYLLHEYLRISDDHGMLALVDFYKTYRAIVRGKVAGLRRGQVQGEARQAAEKQAQSFFNLATSYCLAPSLVITCGLPGSGKSWLAKQIARSLEFAVFNSDRTRKTLAGMDAKADGSAAYGEGIYSRSSTAASYEQLLNKARRSLQSGRSVVIDAGFRSAAQRAAFRELAKELSAPIVLLHADPDEDVMRTRLLKRAAEGGSESDAGVDIHARAKADFELPAEFKVDEHLTIHGELAAERLVAELLELIIAQTTGS